MGFLEGNSEVLERLVMEVYARGMSTRDVEDAFRDVTGELVISRTAVSELTDGLWEQYETFTSRDLSDVAVEYLFVDGIYESPPSPRRQRSGVGGVGDRQRRPETSAASRRGEQRIRELLGRVLRLTW